MTKDKLGLLKERLLAPLPGRQAQELMLGRVRAMPVTVPPTAVLSAVLCLLFPIGNDLHILLMKRGEDRSAHSGQVSFPGGRYEDSDNSLTETALREANEEVGINPTDVEILAPLTSLYIPVSNFNVFPFLGYYEQRPEYNLSHNEVAHILEVPLATLFHPQRKIVTDVSSPATREVIKNVHAYYLEDGTIIWGATAMILSEIEAIMTHTIS